MNKLSHLPFFNLYRLGFFHKRLSRSIHSFNYNINHLYQQKLGRSTYRIIYVVPNCKGKYFFMWNRTEKNRSKCNQSFHGLGKCFEVEGVEIEGVAIEEVCDYLDLDSEYR